MAGNKNSGRRPMPTGLKIHRGNPGKGPLPQNEPKPSAKLPQAPKWLGAEARKQYNTQGKKLLKLGVLKETDADQWAMYCHCWQQYIECVEKVKVLGVVVVQKDDKGRVQLRQNQYMAEMHKLMKTLKELATQFGLTPSSRTGISASTEECESDFAKLLNGTF